MNNTLKQWFSSCLALIWIPLCAPLSFMGILVVNGASFEGGPEEIQMWHMIAHTHILSGILHYLFIYLFKRHFYRSIIWMSSVWWVAWVEPQMVIQYRHQMSNWIFMQFLFQKIASFSIPTQNSSGEVIASSGRCLFNKWISFRWTNRWVHKRGWRNSLVNIHSIGMKSKYPAVPDMMQPMKSHELFVKPWKVLNISLQMRFQVPSSSFPMNSMATTKP